MIHSEEKTLWNFTEYWTKYGTHLRYGQAFVNFFDIKNMPELFYEEDMDKAQKMAMQIVIDWQIPLS